MASTVALLLGMAVGSEAQAALEPHRAAYRLALAAKQEATPLSDVQGGLVIEWERACDGWLSQQRLFFIARSEEGDQFGQDVRYSSWEAIDGLRMRYSVRSFEGEQLQEEYRGEAQVDPGDGGVATFSTPPDAEVALPPGTIFPTDHMERVLSAAGEGVRVISHEVFDGWGLDALTQITSVIGPPRMIEPIAGEAGLQTGGEQAGGGRAWPVSMAYYNQAKGADLPEFEASFMLTEGGVLRNLVLDYGEFKLDAVLERLELLTQPDC
jgi:hypothetical protein